MAVSVSEHIDRILTEQPIGMSAAARLMGSFRNNRGCHPSTIVRWCHPGVRLPDGRLVALEHIKVAGRLMTSRPAILRFIAAQQVHSIETIESPRTSAERRRAQCQAKSQLEEMGVK